MRARQDLTEGELLCPSSQADTDGAVVFGVIGGTVDEPRVSYLADPVPVTSTLLEMAKPVEPTEVFRIGAKCAEQKCLHFNRDHCELGRRIVRMLPTAVDKLPACRLRPRCRWWREQGAQACFRCPLVVTRDFRSTPILRDVSGLFDRSEESSLDQIRSSRP